MNCPNCITSWKCNDPHIIKNSSGYYTSSDGIFTKEFKEWKFIPYEKSFNSNQLLDIINTLNILNETQVND